MKRIIALVLSLLVVFAFVSCGETATDIDAFNKAIKETNPTSVSVNVKYTDTKEGITLEGVFTSEYNHDGTISVDYSYDEINVIDADTDDWKTRVEGTATIDKEGNVDTDLNPVVTSATALNINLAKDKMTYTVEAGVLSADVKKENTKAVLGVELPSDAKLTVTLDGEKLASISIKYDTASGPAEVNGLYSYHTFEDQLSYNADGHWYKATCEHKNVRKDFVEHNCTSVKTAVSCTTEGYTTYTCVDCGYVYKGDIVPASGHPFSTDIAYDEFSHWYVPVCEHEEEKGSEALHNFTDGTIFTVAPTCSTEGYTHYECTCGYSYKDNMVAKNPANHEYSTTLEYDESEHWYAPTCSCEDAENKSEPHTLVQTVVLPTCGTEGYVMYSCKCGYKFIDESSREPATGSHNYVLDEESGKYVCTECDAIKPDEEE